MKILPKNHEILAIVDTQIFIPALASREIEARFYSCAIRKGWKFVFSPDITEEYCRVIHKFGSPAAIVQIEVTRLTLLNKYRLCEVDQNIVPDELAPRKDRHIIAPCLVGRANTIVSNDGGILERAQAILKATGASVLSLQQAQSFLNTLPDGE